MSEMKPTPGPWNANYFKGKNRDGWTIDGPDMVPDYENPMFNEADARLIAAAPELLAALRGALQLIELVVPFDGDETRNIRAAISKATQ